MLRTEILFIKRTKVAVHDTRNFGPAEQFGYFALIVFIHEGIIPGLLAQSLNGRRRRLVRFRGVDLGVTPHDSLALAMPLAGALDDRQRGRRPSSTVHSRSAGLRGPDQLFPSASGRTSAPFA